MAKRLYTGFSLFQFIIFIALRLVLVFVIIVSLSHFDENRIVISIIAAISFLLLLAIGDDQIVVYDDRIIQSDNSFLSLCFGLGSIIYHINDIKVARLKPTSVHDLIEDVAAIALSSILPRMRSNSNKTEPIFFDLKSGKTVQINTNLEDYKMKRIVELVNSLVG